MYSDFFCCSRVSWPGTSCQCLGGGSPIAWTRCPCPERPRTATIAFRIVNAIPFPETTPSVMFFFRSFAVAIFVYCFVLFQWLVPLFHDTLLSHALWCRGAGEEGAGGRWGGLPAEPEPAGGQSGDEQATLFGRASAHADICPST